MQNFGIIWDSVAFTLPNTTWHSDALKEHSKWQMISPQLTSGIT
jgi:hypothetical protein